LRKVTPTSGEISWDVLTESNLPPASGIYIYRISVPGVGHKVGKLAIFTEREQLRIY
jgi:hypothetical protein